MTEPIATQLNLAGVTSSHAIIENYPYDGLLQDDQNAEKRAYKDLTFTLDAAVPITEITIATAASDGGGTTTVTVGSEQGTESNTGTYTFANEPAAAEFVIARTPEDSLMSLLSVTAMGNCDCDDTNNQPHWKIRPLYDP